MPRSGLDSDLNNVAPRVGVSWDLTGRGTLVLRGGYGLFYDSGTLIENSALYFNPPYWQLQLFFPSETGADLDRQPVPDRRAASRRAPTVNTIARDFRTGYAQQASLGLERAFTALTLTARYVGAFGDGYVRKRNLNQPRARPRATSPPGGRSRATATSCSSSRRRPRATTRCSWRWSGRSARGLAFKAGYTWSTSEDDTSAFLATDGDDNTPQNSRDFAAEWGPSDFDVRHRLVASATWNVPTRDSAPAAFRHWQVSGVLTAQSGRPFTPRDQRRQQQHRQHRRRHLRLRPAERGRAGHVRARASTTARASSSRRSSRFGNAGRNSLTGPGYASLDLALSKRLALGASRALELRLEIFNALSRANLLLPDSFVDRPTFGQSLSALPARQAQLAARLMF